MFQIRLWSAVLVLFAAMLSGPANLSAAAPRSKRIPLNIYTSKECNEKGVNYACYEGTWSNLPDFSKLKPVKTGKSPKIDLSGRNKDESFGMKFTGFLKVEVAGVFEFFLSSDDGSRFYVGSKLLVDNNGTHGMAEKVGNTDLPAGVHPITLTYFNSKTNARGLKIENCIPLPWHVKEAEIRIPVNVSLIPAWSRMPPHEYLADLNPVERKDLNFDRKTKSAILRDIRSPEDKAKIIERLKERCRRNKQAWKPEFYRLHGNPIMKVNGSVTYALKPEYKWFSLRIHGGYEVRVDGKKISAVVNMQGTVNPGDPRFPTSKNECATLLPIPPGGKKLTFKADANSITQAGFISSGPTVARVVFQLPAYDPTNLIPVVYNSSGQRVGCRILWAHPGEPMSIVFDCSTGDKRYLVYLVDRSKKPARLSWAPKAGLILESRYPKRYDPSIRTVNGFLKLWDAADSIAGKKEMTRIWKVFYPFRPFAGTTANYARVIGGARMAMSCYTGYFRVPDTRQYQFHFKTQPGGYFLIDDQLISQFKYHEAQTLAQKGSRAGYKRFAVELTKGTHRLEMCQYGSAEKFTTLLGWGIPGKETDLEPLGVKFSTWEPIADAGADAIGHRDKKLLASFAWQHKHQCWGKYPAGDIVCLSFTARLPKKPGGAVYRWRFDDGHIDEGETVEHHFMSPGLRKVTLEVLDGPDGKVLASVAGTVHAHLDWSWPQDADRGHVTVPHCMAMIKKRFRELESVTPIEQVVSLYYWALQNQWAKLRDITGSALSKRIDEVIKKLPYPRLLELAKSMGAPREAHYDAAEKLLAAVMDRAPAGAVHWRAATMTLAEILTNARTRPKRALELLVMIEKTKPEIDMTSKWKKAGAKQWRCLTESDKLAGVTQGLTWLDAHLPLESVSIQGRGIWLAKDMNLPASRKGKELVLQLGEKPISGAFWFNGKLVGRRWQWPDGNVVIPPEMQIPGGKNQFAVLFQPTQPPAYFDKRPAPKFKISGPAKEQAERYEFARKRITADALLFMGENDQAKEILLKLKENAWPLDEKTRLTLTSDLRRIRQWAKGVRTDAIAALDTINSWLGKHPMLRMDPEFMSTKIEAYSRIGDYPSSYALAQQMRRVNMNESQRRKLMLVQVKSSIQAGEMKIARTIYGELKKLAPYSTATVEAREAIKDSIIDD